MPAALRLLEAIANSLWKQRVEIGDSGALRRHRDLHPLVCRRFDAVAGEMRGRRLAGRTIVRCRIEAAARSEQKEKKGKRGKEKVPLAHI